ncbi:hypothetical protein PR048_001119, partial [Dryococelus australis]
MDTDENNNTNTVTLVEILLVPDGWGSVSHKTEAEAMISAEDEKVVFSQPVLLEGPVELWLCEI